MIGLCEPARSCGFHDALKSPTSMDVLSGCARWCLYWLRSIWSFIHCSGLGVLDVRSLVLLMNRWRLASKASGEVLC